MDDARILERGYRRYDGPRGGTAQSVRSLTVHSLRRVLGLRRPFRSKALPAFVILVSYLPALVMVGISVLFEIDAGDLVDYAEYYGFIIIPVLLFIAFTAPEVLCPDRRHRTLGLYLASPLTRDTYLLAKVVSVLTVLLAVTLGPLLLLLVAQTLVGSGPDGVGGFLETLGQILAAGVILSTFLGLLSLAVASFTDRRAFASVGIIVLLVAGTTITEVLYDGGDGVTWAPTFLPHTALAFEAATVVYDPPERCAPGDEDCFEREYPDLPAGGVIGAAAGWTLLSGLVLRQRYQWLKVSG
jgi:ABC-2 type transport system permease protein